MNDPRSPNLGGRSQAGTGYPGLLTVVFFLLYHRCNVEKVPSNSQLEIEGNRSGSVLYSHVSKCRYPNRLIPKELEPNFSLPPADPYLECGMEARMLQNTHHGFGVVCAVFPFGVRSVNALLKRCRQPACPSLPHLGRGFPLFPLPVGAASV